MSRDRRKKGFALEKHQILGNDLYLMRTYLERLKGDSFQAYPIKEGLLPLVEKTIYCVNAMRSRLDDFVFMEHPDLGIEEKANIYYPGSPKNLDS